MDVPAIIYEDVRFLIVNKPAGIVVHSVKHSTKRGAKRGAKHGAKGGMGHGGAKYGTGRDTKAFHEPTLAEWIVKKYPEVRRVGDDPELRPGIVHRLDKETSGVMVVARDQKYFEYLKTLFRDRKVEKTYLALVAARPRKEKGIIDAPIGIRNGTMKRSLHFEKMAKSAVTEYKVLKTFVRKVARHAARGSGDAFSLLEVHPRTGRTHQIRVHLASIGHPIVGDHLYGSKKQPAWVHRLMLHALSLELTTAEGKRMKFEAEPPEDFQDAIIC